MESKPWWTSKTLWVNVIALIACIIQLNTGLLLDGATQGIILAAINMALRLFVTKQSLDAGSGKSEAP